VKTILFLFCIVGYLLAEGKGNSLDLHMGQAPKETAGRGAAVHEVPDTLMNNARKLVIMTTVGNKTIEEKYKRQWLKERSVLLLISLTRLATLRQPLIGIGTRKLTKGAYSHSIDMASKKRFGHYDSNERSLKWDFNGENVISDYRSAFAIYLGWMSSPGHRRNLLYRGFFFTGIGICKKVETEKYIVNGEIVKQSRKIHVLGTQLFR